MNQKPRKNIPIKQHKGYCVCAAPYSDITKKVVQALNKYKCNNGIM